MKERPLIDVRWRGLSSVDDIRCGVMALTFSLKSEIGIDPFAGSQSQILERVLRPWKCHESVVFTSHTPYRPLWRGCSRLTCPLSLFHFSWKDLSGIKRQKHAFYCLKNRTDASIIYSRDPLSSIACVMYRRSTCIREGTALHAAEYFYV